MHHASAYTADPGELLTTWSREKDGLRLFIEYGPGAGSDLWTVHFETVAKGETPLEPGSPEDKRPGRRRGFLGGLFILASYDLTSGTHRVIFDTLEAASTKEIFLLYKGMRIASVAPCDADGPEGTRAIQRARSQLGLSTAALRDYLRGIRTEWHRDIAETYESGHIEPFIRDQIRAGA